MSYFRPTSRNAILEPEAALTVSSRLERSVAIAYAAPGNQLGIPADQPNRLVTNGELFDQLAADCAARSENGDHGYPPD